jgi:hypothetical protein
MATLFALSDSESEGEKLGEASISQSGGTTTITPPSAMAWRNLMMSIYRNLRDHTFSYAPLILMILAQGMDRISDFDLDLKKN